MGKERLRKLTLANSSWMSVERWVALREPVDRTLHHFRHLVDYFFGVDDTVRNDVDRAGVFRDLYAKLWRLVHIPKDSWQDRDFDISEGVPLAAIGGLADWVRLWLGLASNYQVRSLAGAGN